MRSWTGSQWSLRMGMMWSVFLHFVTVLAAAFCAACTRLICVWGKPARRLLQWSSFDRISETAARISSFFAMYVCLDLEHIAVCSVAFVLDLQSGWTFHYHHDWEGFQLQLKKRVLKEALKDWMESLSLCVQVMHSREMEQHTWRLADPIVLS